jgi:hypothetical protein
MALNRGSSSSVAPRALLALLSAAMLSPSSRAQTLHLSGGPSRLVINESLVIDRTEGVTYRGEQVIGICDNEPHLTFLSIEVLTNIFSPLLVFADPQYTVSRLNEINTPNDARRFLPLKNLAQETVDKTLEPCLQVLWKVARDNDAANNKCLAVKAMNDILTLSSQYYAPPKSGVWIKERARDISGMRMGCGEERKLREDRTRAELLEGYRTRVTLLKDRARAREVAHELFLYHWQSLASDKEAQLAVAAVLVDQLRELVSANDLSLGTLQFVIRDIGYLGVVCKDAESLLRGISRSSDSASIRYLANQALSGIKRPMGKVSRY